MASVIRWSVVAALVAVIVVVPIVYFRCVYDTHKRLRIVEPGRVYRSGQMTAEGFADAVKSYGLRTIINVQDDFPDPDISLGFWDRRTIKESELCRRLGVRYVHLMPTLLPRHLIPQQRPPSIDQLLSVLDDDANYPVLIHCHAGLHRTGLLTAIYRMEYQGWTADQAFLDMKAQGFGSWVCTSANDYVKQFVLTYQPGVRTAHALSPSSARSAAE
ncbi:MAG TPA: dual specificity protein phosphatase family protein [Gemmataceae bacterium]|nr:dual specificity protein phosphatase family protein [Gemmataceae bacterium]